MPTPGKNFEGQKGFPTPDSAPDEIACRVFRVPASDEWLGVLMGAAEVLMSSYNWYAWGSYTVDEAADAWAAIINQTYEDSLTQPNCEGSNVEAPYWDTEGDADDTAPRDAQDWYGEIEAAESGYEWHERIEDWAIAGFIAYSGQPLAALQFLTLAPKFRLAFRRHDLGGIVRVFLDADEVGQVDTYSETADIVTFGVVCGSEHNLWVVMSETCNDAIDIGDAEIQVIREELAAADVSPPDLRYNPECDCIEQTPDGGTTWVENPAADPRHGSGFRLPPLEGEDARCDAAARETAAWREVYDTFIAAGNAAMFATQILNILLVLSGGVGILITLMLGLFGVLITIGKSEMESAFDDDVWDAIKCIIYNQIGEDGSVSETELSAIYDEIFAQYPGVIYNTLIEIGHLFGEVLLSNASVERAEIGDCADCADVWCYVFDFETSDGGFEAWEGFGEYEAGVGWHVHNITGAYAYLLTTTLPTADYTDMTFVHQINSYGINGAFEFGDYAAPDTFNSWCGITPTETGEISWTFNSLNCPSLPATGGYGFYVNFSGHVVGDVILKSITMSGTGENPFGSDNCP